MHRTKSVALSVFALLPSLAAAQQREAPKSFAEAEAIYEKHLSRPALFKRTEGRREIAKTKELEAFEILKKDYARPEKPKEVVSALCVHLAFEFFGGQPFGEEWAAWRADRSKPRDAWLWLCGLQAEAKSGSDAWVEIAQSRSPAVLRAAAITAGAEAARAMPDNARLAWLSTIIEDERVYGVEREILLESVLDHFDDREPSLLHDGRRALLRALTHAMADSRLSTRSKLVMARGFARTLDRDNVGPYPEVWRALLEDEVSEAAEVDFARRKAAHVPGFFGIPEHSKHVVYVIDVSDSMLTPLTSVEKGQLTGVEEKPTEADKQASAVAGAIDWSKVSTRFDAARELLLSSIGRLSPDHRFAVVLFGDKAEPMKATPKLVEPKGKTIEAVHEELAAIRPGPATNERPHGTLLGKTNLHGGITRAFELTTKRKIRKDLPVAIKSFDTACDTIYVLSDGAPSWDDYDCVDINDIGFAGDPETGTSQKFDGENLHYYGPFQWGGYILPDVRRMNMLRRSSIHTISIGEADDQLMQRIADQNDGQFVKIGGSK